MSERSETPSHEIDLTIEPACGGWAGLARKGVCPPFSDWREKTRLELSLPTDRPIIATGHQTLLWHPGILVKYLLTDAVARAAGLAQAALIVDQHAGGFGSYEVPVSRRDGGLAVRRIELTRPRAEVPMSLHPPFMPVEPARHLRSALPSVAGGVDRIYRAVAAHRNARNAALQMGAALEDLMRPWVDPPAPAVTATDLLGTSLAAAMMGEMARDPARCAQAYNEAVARFPDADVAPLLIRDDYVELPLWRVRADGRRMHAYDNDVADHLAGAEQILMPRALLLTALVRLGMCDLFVHGLGGANYDRAMEAWIEAWLGTTPQPIAVASATLRLPLRQDEGPPPDVSSARAEARRVWHDPEPPSERGPGPVKRELLEAIDATDRGTPARRAAFFAMHRELARLRSFHVGRVERLQHRAADAIRWINESAIVDRRDWPFPLYPKAMIDDLARAVRERVGAPAAENRAARSADQAL